MDFKESILGLQTLARDKRDDLLKVLEFLSSGQDDEAVKALENALEFAEWDTAYINDLPDSAFAHVEAGDKDESGKTVPRSKRHFPHHGKAGALDLPHLRNALARAPQSPFGPKASTHLKRHASGAGVGEAAASEVFKEGWLTGVELGELGKAVQIIKTGEFQHPQHGLIQITIDDLNEMVKHFNSQVRGQQIPVDVDHKHELGAVGWFKSLKGPEQVNGEHALFADINWTDKGREAIKGGAFKYFSPHFGEWTDPESGHKYKNVLLSGAITNFPFLKGMQPVSFNEFKEGSVDSVTVEEFNALKDKVEETTKSVGELTEQIKASLIASEKQKLTEKVGASAEISDEDKDALVAEIEAAEHMTPEEKAAMMKKIKASEKSEDNDNPKFSEIRSEFQAKEADLQKKLTEAETKIAAIERQGRTVKFMEIITGKGGDDAPWVGSADKHLLLMESLADRFGEDSEQYKSYVELQTSHAKQIAESALFSEAGTTGGGPVSMDEEIEVGVKKLMESDKELTLAEATSQWLEKNPKYYNKYDAAQKRRIAQAGG